MLQYKELIIYTYLAILSVLSIYGAHRYVLVYLYYRYKGRKPKPHHQFEKLPRITVQLPLFNEATVIDRLLDAVAKLDYPHELLDIQVLDDSIDETCELAQAKVEELRATGLDVIYRHREDRVGFKAGALAAGLKEAKGEFVAIFDADFVPDPQILQNAVHHFTKDDVGMVQVRWGHLNRNYSLLTRLQAMLLDGHFVVEHTARNRSGRHFNFNGTAGVWRRETIDHAGGWQHDTLTEDLDLSYRAQMRGWKFVYLLDFTTPGELPVEMSAFKTQQHRWAKGSIQTARKILPALWRSDASLKIKIEATFHLTANIAYPLLLLMCLLMLPALKVRLEDTDRIRNFLFDASVFVLATISVASFYAVAQREIDKRWRRSILYLPGVMSIGVGLAVNNARAVIEALLSHETPFVRTPKYNVGNASDRPTRRYKSVAGWVPYIEIGFGLYICVILWVALTHYQFLMSAFLLLFAAGFFSVGVGSLLGRGGRLPGKLFSAVNPTVAGIVLMATFVGVAIGSGEPAKTGINLEERYELDGVERDRFFCD